VTAYIPSEVGIASAASVHLGRDPIVDFGDLEDTHAQIFKERYPAVRDALLRSYPWNFAMHFASLAGSVLPVPQFGFTHKFELPAGGDLGWCLRLWAVEGSAKYAVRGRDIFSTQAPPLTVSYVKREENPEIYDPIFSELLAVELALALVNRIPTDEVRKRTREIMATRKELRRSGKLTDAMEQSAGTYATNGGQGSWLDARRPA